MSFDFCKSNNIVIVKSPCIVIAGGDNRKEEGGSKPLTSVEVISSFSREKMELPSLPEEITQDVISTKCSMFIHDGALMVFACTGTYSFLKNPWKCFEFNNGKWKEHSTLKRNRSCSTTVATDKGTFIFGGNESHKTFEYLPIGSQKWKNGKKGQLPGGFFYGCAIQIKNKHEILLINGITDKILSFNINSHTSQELPFRLNFQREFPACAYIPGTNKILVTGGISGAIHQSSCEIIDTEDGTVKMASDMNYARCTHGVGIINVNGEDRLAVFGGSGYGGRRHDSIELYNAKTQKWELTEDFKLNVPRSGFGFVNI